MCQALFMRYGLLPENSYNQTYINIKTRRTKMMNAKTLGIVLLVVGIILLGWGYNISQSVSSQFSSAFSGSPSDKAMYMFISGGICAVLGIFKILGSK